MLKAIPEMAAMAVAVIRGLAPKDLEKILCIVRKTFPTVRQVSADQMALFSRPLVLIDVRRPKEFAISHLENAVNMTRKDEIEQHAVSRPADTIVLYCSVGFRSSRLATQLQKKGIENVVNLDGGIFEWGNQSRPLFASNKTTRLVHPFGRLWRGLLKPGVASDC